MSEGAAKPQSWESGRLSAERVAEDTCETYGGMRGGVTGHVTSRG